MKKTIVYMVTVLTLIITLFWLNDVDTYIHKVNKNISFGILTLIMVCSSLILMFGKKKFMIIYLSTSLFMKFCELMYVTKVTENALFKFVNGLLDNVISILNILGALLELIII